MMLATVFPPASQLIAPPVSHSRQYDLPERYGIPLFELLEFNNAMRDVVLKTPTIQAIRDIAGQGLFTTLQQYGYQLVTQGVTSMEEVDRVSGSE